MHFFVLRMKLLGCKAWVKFLLNPYNNIYIIIYIYIYNNINLYLQTAGGSPESNDDLIIWSLLVLICLGRQNTKNVKTLFNFISKTN